MTTIDWKINDAYIPYVECQARTQIFFGGSSSGKSVFLAQRDVNDLLTGGRNFLIGRNTGKTHKTSTHNEMCKVIGEWGLNKYFDTPKSDLTITCKNGYQAIFIGLDDVEKVKSITPLKGIITDIRIEEATETNVDDYRQLTKRLRGISPKAKRLTLSFNPIMRTHWIFKEFFTDFHDGDRELRTPDLTILKTTYKDNRFLDPEDGRFLESEKNEYYYNVYTLGQWGVLGEVVFNNWRVENLAGLRDSFGTYYNGLDFGYTNDPTAFCRCAIKGKTLYVTHSFYEYGLTNDLIAERLKPIVGNEVVRCDPADPKSIAELRGYGINAVAARGGKGSVNHGIQYIQQYEVIVHRELQEPINELQLYQWERNKAGDVMNTPVDRNNHFIDAFRYSLSGISFTAPRTQEGKFDRRLLGLPM